VIPDPAELQHRARQLLPPEVYHYYAGGSGRERTLRANERAWRRVWLAPRILRDVGAVSTATELLSAALATPVGVAPTGFQGLAHPDGELATAAAAARAGALFVLSTRSTRRIEDVGAVMTAEGGTWWFQAYIMRDRDLTASLVRRAVAAGAAAMVLTADTPVVGRKRRDSRDLAISDADFMVNTGPLADPADAEQAANLTFADIGWLSEISGGLPVLAKGVLRGDDARACFAAGAAAVIVSNHGGRQLDGAVPAVTALPAVVAAVRAGPAGPARTDAPPGGPARTDAPPDGPARTDAPPDGPARTDAPPDGPARTDGRPVYLDGGVRSGEQVLTALALGAGAVFLGRPVLWALACGGADAVQALLTGMTADLAHSMALAGAASLPEISGLLAADGR
jgi:4-hydroxymandelate oxidase